MAKKEKNEVTPEEETEEVLEVTAEETAETPETPEADPWEEKYNAERDAHLRLAAEYDNFRKRTAKEKEQTYNNGKGDAVEKLLPVYDNLERALNQPTEDAAYKKGVELTMNELNLHLVRIRSVPYLASQFRPLCEGFGNRRDPSPQCCQQ